MPPARVAGAIGYSVVMSEYPTGSIWPISRRRSTSSITAPCPALRFVVNSPPARPIERVAATHLLESAPVRRLRLCPRRAGKGHCFMRLRPQPLIFALSLLGAAEPARAQSGAATWLEPVMVWDESDAVSDPRLVTDAGGNAHLFFLGRSEGATESILYHIDPDDAGQGNPVDVLIGVAPDYDVVADPFGSLHLLFNGAGSTLQYASVAGARAGDSQAWERPENLGSATPGAAIAVGADGALHVVFGRQQDIYYLRSDDGGESWLEPTRLASAQEPRIAAHLAAMIDRDDTLHCYWSEVSPPDYHPSEGLFHSTSDDAGATWADPAQIAGEHYTLPGLLTDAAGIGHLIWQGDVAVGGRYYRRLAGGDWSATEEVLPAGEGGMSGDAPMAVDSAGNLHVVTVGDVGPRWVVRTGSGWSNPVDITRSQEDLPSEVTSIEYPALAIAGGNQLMAAWEFGFKRIYLARAIVDAPAVEPTAPPARPTAPPPPTRPRPTRAPASTATAAAGEPAMPASSPDRRDLVLAPADGYLPIALAFVLSATVIVAVVVFKYRR